MAPCGGLGTRVYLTQLWSLAPHPPPPGGWRDQAWAQDAAKLSTIRWSLICQIYTLVCGACGWGHLKRALGRVQGPDQAQKKMQKGSLLGVTDTQGASLSHCQAGSQSPSLGTTSPPSPYPGLPF